MEKTLSRIIRTLNVTRAMTLTLIVLAIAILILLFYKATPKESAVNMKNEAKEQLRQAELMQITARIDSVRIEYKISKEDAKRNAEGFTKALNENTNEFKKITNEKPNDYRSYSSKQLQSAVANEVRQYITGK